eukprot:TRINITY_DN2674_c0_g3_i1.p1 TRINITY_DN2674_c0_g3~~TRINITY_DN2674_c0_g3_i1.p1  ORF type:complete len:242 (-),score=27.98 TRINITY_DN2674_c0_g3_i1:268-993(-)
MQANRCTYAQRNQFTEVLLPIRERRLRVRFALRYNEEIKFNVDDLGKKKAIASRAQDCYALSNEQLVYQIALTTRRERARDQPHHVIIDHARARAEVLRISLDTHDEAHLGFEGLVDLEQIKAQEDAAFDEAEANVVGSADDVTFVSDCDDLSPKFWSFCSSSPRSGHEDAAPNYWSSSSRSSGTVMDGIRSFRSACSRMLSSTSFRGTTLPRRHPLSLTPRSDSRVMPVLDDNMDLARST